ncbi:unnamed protein product [Adineta steineri]|uniref:F-box domain-containing protein n=1 Tax=Adineta steineri TaxID=433720 RepID=A0A814UF54_9BILA|nr:unnamed protein product [Adineta steineri]CAF4063123.1 unnamed protein product [Adineta steineri]
MNRSNVHFLDLPDEILLIILAKLNNIDVHYSLLNVHNRRLSVLCKEKIFNNILDFTSIKNDSLNNCRKFNQICNEILPRLCHNVKYFIVELNSMERILLAANYPNLTQLKIVNFKQDIALQYFTDESYLRNIFQQQITQLILINNDTRDIVGSSENYTKNVYGKIFNLFKNLKQFSVDGTGYRSYPFLTLCNLPSTTLFSSTLIYLYINVCSFDDCLYLLDGRLKQLTTLIVHISYMDDISTVRNIDELVTLKYFSFKYDNLINSYDTNILPLLRRMKYLEKLTLYLRVQNRSTFIDKTHLENEILSYIPTLQLFTFYISTYNKTIDLFHNMVAQQSTIYIKNQHVNSIINYISSWTAVCSIFSIPFEFHRLQDIGNLFPNIIFNHVTYLLVQDIIPLNHEFFIRVARAFPLLKTLRVFNLESQSSNNTNTCLSKNNNSNLIA